MNILLVFRRSFVQEMADLDFKLGAWPSTAMKSSSRAFESPKTEPLPSASILLVQYSAASALEQQRAPLIQPFSWLEVAARQKSSLS